MSARLNGTAAQRRAGPRDTGLFVVLAMTILVLAAALRFYRLGAQSLWADEGNSVALAARTLAQIARDSANDIHPPLYYWLLHFWTRVFGTTESDLRSLSALLGVLLVLATGQLGRRLFDRWTGLLAAFIAALAPFQVYYSQEARMYILLALEAAAAVFAFWRLLSREDARLPVKSAGEGDQQPAPLVLMPFSAWLLILTWVAGLYTHYAFPAIIGLLTLLYAGWLVATRGRGQVGRRVLRWLLFLAITLGLYAPWLRIAVRQLTSWPVGTSGLPFGTQLESLLATLSLGPAGLRGDLGLWAWLIPLLALAGVFPWPALSTRDRAGSPRLDWLRPLTPAIWVAAPVVMILVLGLYREAYLKFLLIASPALSLLIARGVVGPGAPMLQPRVAAVLGEETDSSATWWRPLVAAAWFLAGITVIIALSGRALATYRQDPVAARDDYRGIARFIEATAGPRDVVLLAAPGQSEVFGYYYRGDRPVIALPAQRPPDNAETLQALSALQENEKVYAVLWALDEADPDGLIEGWLDNSGYKTLDQWRGNVRLAVYVMPSRGAPQEVEDGLDVPLGGQIRLTGYRGWNLQPKAGEVTQLQLLWESDSVPARPYKVFIQLLDARDQVVAQRDSEPAGDSRPTTTWKAGELISDNHGLLIPPGTPPGNYQRIVGLYDIETGIRLLLPDGSDHIVLPIVTVTRSAVPPPLAALGMHSTQGFNFGGISLLGHDRYKRGFGHAPETALAPGDLLHMTLYWQAVVEPRADWWFELDLIDREGSVVARLNAPLVSETYPTSLWEMGEIVRGEHDLRLPDGLSPGRYSLSLQMFPDAGTLAGTAALGSVTLGAPPP